MTLSCNKQKDKNKCDKLLSLVMQFPTIYKCISLKIEYGKIKQCYYLLSAYYVLSADLIYLENAVERRSFINVCVY